MATPPQLLQTNALHKDAFSHRFAAGDNAFRSSILEQRALFEEQQLSANRSIPLQTSRLFLLPSAIGLALSRLIEQLKQ